MTQNINKLFKVFFFFWGGGGGAANFKSKTEENIKLRLFNTKITDLGSIKLNIKSWKTLVDQGTLHGGHTVQRNCLYSMITLFQIYKFEINQFIYILKYQCRIREIRVYSIYSHYPEGVCMIWHDRSQNNMWPSKHSTLYLNTDT
jgi:hypothetical protein